MTAPTCARCPAPATHACDCGAAGCDAHRGCEHEPDRLRAVNALECRVLAGEFAGASHWCATCDVAVASGTLDAHVGDRSRGHALERIGAVRERMAARDATVLRSRAEAAERELAANVAAARAYLAARDRATAATTAEGVSLDERLAAMHAEEDAAEALRRAAGGDVSAAPSDLPVAAARAFADPAVARVLDERLGLEELRRSLPTAPEAPFPFARALGDVAAVDLPAVDDVQRAAMAGHFDGLVAVVALAPYDRLPAGGWESAVTSWGAIAWVDVHRWHPGDAEQLRGMHYDPAPATVVRGLLRLGRGVALVERAQDRWVCLPGEPSPGLDLYLRASAPAQGVAPLWLAVIVEAP